MKEQKQLADVRQEVLDVQKLSADEQNLLANIQQELLHV